MIVNGIKISWEDFKESPKPTRYKTVKLKEPERCSCDGKLVYMERDLHKSAGYIPCQNIYCVNGWITHKSKPVYRVPCRKKTDDKKDRNSA